MKKAVLQRNESTVQGTTGILTFGEARCKTLELPWKDNVKQVSCIPTGTYILTWGRSPSKGWCYHVNNVPGRANVLVHSANFAGSVEDGFVSELLGCIALATYIGQMRNPESKMQLAGLVSKPMVDKFNYWGSMESISLEIS